MKVDKNNVNDTAIDWFKRNTIVNFDTIFGENIHIRCYAHIINLIVAKGLKEIDDSIIKICDPMRYMKAPLKDVASLRL